MRLPGGFSPVNLVKQAGSYVNPTGGTADYDVFGDYSFQGGQRNPVSQTGSVLGVAFGPQNAPSGGAPAPSGGGWTGGGATSGGGGGAAADPYARWGGQAGYTAKRNTFGATQAGYEGGARQTLRDTGNTYDQKTRQFLTGIEEGQGDINQGLARNQLNLRQSMAKIIRGIQTGIRSGGVALAGMNAMDSGASDALARAYARSGNNQTGEARGEAAGVAEELQRQQGQLNQKRNEGVLDLDTFRDTESGRVRADFGNKLQLLAAQAEGEGFGGTVNQGLVDQVLGEALARLSQIDQSRNQRLGGIQQWSPDQIIAEALRLEQAGQPGEAFSVEGPDVNYGGGASTGAPLGQLPIFVKGKDELAVVPKKTEQ